MQEGQTTILLLIINYKGALVFENMLISTKAETLSSVDKINDISVSWPLTEIAINVFLYSESESEKVWPASTQLSFNFVQFLSDSASVPNCHKRWLIWRTIHPRRWILAKKLWSMFVWTFCLLAQPPKEENKNTNVVNAIIQHPIKAILEYIRWNTVEKSLTNVTNAIIHVLEQQLWGCTWGDTMERGLTNATSVLTCVLKQHILWCTKEYTLGRSLSNATNAIIHVLWHLIWGFTRKRTLGRNLTNVPNAILHHLRQ